MEVFVKEWRFYKKILFLSAPIILQQILRVMVDLCDSMMLSRVGEIEMAAVTQAQQLFFIFYTIVGGMSVSACVLISQYWGRRDLDKIKDLYAIGIRANFCFAFFILFLFCFFSKGIMSFYSTKGEVLNLSSSFLRVSSFSYPLCAMSVMIFACFRGIEVTSISFYVNLISYPLNILLNYILIFGKGIFPKLGIYGSAVGTLTARLIELLILLIFLLVIDKKITFRFTDFFRRNKKLSGDFRKVAMPIVAHEIIWSVGTTAGSSITGRLDVLVVAGYNIANIFYQCMGCFMNGILHACSVTIGNTIGSGADRGRIKKEAYNILLIGFLGGLFLGSLTFLLQNQFLALFPLSEITRNYAKGFILILALIWPFSGVEMTGMIAVLRAGGDGKTGFISDIFTMWLITIPLASIAAFWLHLSPFIVVSIVKLNIVLEATVGFIRVLSMKWIKKII